MLNRVIAERLLAWTSIVCGALLLVLESLYGLLYGEVAAVQEDLVVLKLADNLKVRVAKSAISGMEGGPELIGKR